MNELFWLAAKCIIILFFFDILLFILPRAFCLRPKKEVPAPASQDRCDCCRTKFFVTDLVSPDGKHVYCIICAFLIQIWFIQFKKEERGMCL